jgi:hypothetical protein
LSAEAARDVRDVLVLIVAGRSRRGRARARASVLLLVEVSSLVARAPWWSL